MPTATGSALAVRAQLEQVHRDLACDQEGLDRVAVALYDDATGGLRTFVHSTRGRAPFMLYEAALPQVPSLVELAEMHADRVLDDLEVLRGSPAVHTRLLLAHGFRSSYTHPFFERDRLVGFVFFDSTQPSSFRELPPCRLAAFAELVGLKVTAALAPARLLRAAVDVTREIARLRDEETGQHLERMSRYTRLIAREVAGREGRDDEFVEYVHLFAPLHDVGKIGVPDAVLLKRGRLTSDEIAVMRRHVERGVELVTLLASTFGLRAEQHVDLLRNVVAAHHECVDGSGYPVGLAGSAIPLEARIVAVADVFDALTTARPYKPAWSNDEAFAWLDEHAGRRLDAECVHALATRRSEVETIQRRFLEPPPSGAYDLIEA